MERAELEVEMVRQFRLVLQKRQRRQRAALLDCGLLDAISLLAPIQPPDQDVGQFFAAAFASSEVASPTTVQAHSAASRNARYCGSVRKVRACSFE